LFALTKEERVGSHDHCCRPALGNDRKRFLDLALAAGVD